MSILMIILNELFTVGVIVFACFIMMVGKNG